MMNKNWKRLLSLLLVLCMVTSPLASNIAFAKTESDCHVHDETCGYVEAASCTHEHNETCGYVEATEEIPCIHVHDESCGYIAPSAEKPCGHIHDEDCNYAAPILEVACDHTHSESCGYIAPMAGVPCDCDMPEGNHTPECSYAPVVEGSPCTHIHGDCSYVAPVAEVACTHTHDDVCGYAAAVEGAPCTHVHNTECCYAPAVDGADCTHIHDENCGYAEGAPCTYVAPEEPEIISGFEAVLHTAPELTNSGITLSSDGTASAQLSSEGNLLEVTWDYALNQSNVLEVKVSDGLYMALNTWSKIDGATDAFIPANPDDTASVQSGTLRYTTAAVEGSAEMGSASITVILVGDSAPTAAPAELSVSDGVTTESVVCYASKPELVTLEENSADCGFTAILYNTGDSQGTGVELQEDGSELTLALSGTANLLHIDWTIDPSKENTLNISVPEGIYIDTNWTSVEKNSHLALVSFRTLDRDAEQEGIQQAFSTYYNEKTGTLTYTTKIENTAVDTIPIDVMLYLDVALWDKYKDDSIGLGANYLTPTEKVNNLTQETAVTVSFTEKSGENKTTLTKNIKNVTTNHEVGIILRGNGGNDNYFSAADEYRTMATHFLVGANNSSVLLKKVDVQYIVSILRTNEAGKEEEISPDWPEIFFDVDSSSLKNGITWDAESHTMSYEHLGSPENSNIFSPEYLINEEIAAQVGLQDGDRLKFTAIFTAESYSGTELEGTLSVKNWVYTESIDADIQLYTQSATIYGPDLFPEDKYEEYSEVIGILALNNTAGTSDSDTIRVVVNFDKDYTEGNTPRMYVNAYNVPLAKGQSTTVTAQVITENGTVVERTYDISSTSDAAGPCIKTESALESFWTVTYEIVVPKGVKLYGNLRYDFSGVFLGRISEDLTAGTSVTASIVYSDSEGGNWIEADRKEIVYTRPATSPTLSIPARINMDQATTTQVTAGGTIYFRGNLESYGYQTYNPHPVLFLALPTGIPTDNITLKYTTASGDTKYATVTLSHTHTNNEGVQKNIYILDLGEDGAYGGITWDNQVGFKRHFELEIKTPTSMGRGNYAIKDHLFVTGKVPWLEDTYCNVTYGNKVAYPYGVYKEDAAAHDFATITTSSVAAFDILPLTTVMDYSTSVKLEDGTDYSDSVDVPAATNYIYRVEMKNNDLQHVVPTVNTALYIPIPHHKQTLSGYMGSDTIDTSEVRLTGPVTINETQWSVGYSVDATVTNYNNHEATFDNASGTYATWYLTEEALTAAGYDWADVVCVKLILKEDFPVAGTDSMTMKLQIMPGDMTESMSYSSSSWSKYKDGQEVLGGVEAATNPITLKVKHNEIDLTNDAKLRKDLQVETFTDVETGASPEAKGTFENYNGVRFYLTGVTLNNLTLVSPSEITTNIANNTLPDAVAQDSTFGMEIMLENDAGEESWVDLASLETAGNVSIGNQTVKALLLGDSKADNDNEIHVRLTNYETFVNMSAERYVEFTLYDAYDSLYLTFRVDVSRMLNATKPSTGIAAGEQYNGIGGSTAETASILPDGAATASFQFVGYVPSNHTGGHTLTFSRALPTGTTLILADFTDGYANYYYCNNAGGKTSINLTEFAGLNVSGYFVERTGSDSCDEHFLLIMDFTSTTGLTGNTGITLSVQNNGENQQTEKTVTIQTLDAITYELGTYYSVPADNTLTYDDGFSFRFRHIFGGAESVQYRLADSEYNLRISLTADGISSFPLGTYAIYEGVKYWPEADGKYIIIPSSNSAYNDEYSSPIRIEMPYVQLGNAVSPPARYWITVEWMCAAPNIKGVTQTIGGYRLPTDGEDYKGHNNQRFSVANEIEKAILLGRDDGHLVTVEDLRNGIATFSIQTQGIEAANVTYVLFDKEGKVLSNNPVSGNTLTYADAKPGETYVLKASCGGVTDTYVLVTVE